MNGQTQLIIDGVEVVLPQNFSTTVKRENSFFTKNGEYTYDCTLSLDNQTNRQLYGFLQRLNKTESVQSKRPAVLIADGKVYCRGTEVITGWTDEEVSVQIVSGNSELNYFIGDSLKIEWLDMGEIEVLNTVNMGYPLFDYFLPIIRSAEGHVYNNQGFIGQRVDDILEGSLVRPQPFLCAILSRLISALGYTLGENQLIWSQFYNLFIVNTVRTVKYSEMLSGWRVRDFLKAVEDLCGVCFLTDNVNKTVHIVMKSNYYANARQYPLADVVDEYELNMSDDAEPEFTDADVEYDIPDHRWAKFMRLPDGLLSAMPVKNYADLTSLINDQPTPSSDTTDAGKAILRDTSTGRLYIKKTSTFTTSAGSFGGSSEPAAEEVTEDCWLEVDQFCDLKHENPSGTLEQKISPAPLAPIGGRSCNCEVIDLSMGDTFSTEGNSESSESDEDATPEDTIRTFEKRETAAGDLYCAFFNGGFFITGLYNIPIVYTDAYHASLQKTLYPWLVSFDTSGPMPVGSLRLSDIESELYAGVYRVDTSRQVTFETYDPNTADPRGVFVIRNKRWVCREIEETITAKGRRPRWKITCLPIDLSDEASEQRWVLTRGVWEDGGAWLDDGRWLDG